MKSCEICGVKKASYWRISGRVCNRCGIRISRGLDPMVYIGEKNPRTKDYYSEPVKARAKETASRMYCAHIAKTTNKFSDILQNLNTPDKKKKLLDRMALEVKLITLRKIIYGELKEEEEVDIDISAIKGRSTWLELEAIASGTKSSKKKLSRQLHSKQLVEYHKSLKIVKFEALLKKLDTPAKNKKFFNRLVMELNLDNLGSIILGEEVSIDISAIHSYIWKDLAKIANS